MSNKREELLKRIEETRKKLQSVSKNKFFVPLKTNYVRTSYIHK